VSIVGRDIEMIAIGEKGKKEGTGIERVTEIGKKEDTETGNTSEKNTQEVEAEVRKRNGGIGANRNPQTVSTEPHDDSGTNKLSNND
jgi:hypothetical protein